MRGQLPVSAPPSPADGDGGLSPVRDWASRLLIVSHPLDRLHRYGRPHSPHGGWRRWVLRANPVRGSISAEASWRRVTKGGLKDPTCYLRLSPEQCLSDS